jgi:hypothetical protein
MTNAAMIVTIIRLYDHHDDAANVVRALREAGVPEHDISLLARSDRVHGAATGAEIGAAIGGLAGLITGLGLIAIPGIGPVVAAGWLGATLAGAAAGGWVGGALGVLATAGISGEEAHAITEALRRGGTLVTARVPETEKERCAAIMDRGAVDVRVRIETYRAAGWVAYDPKAAPYTADEIRRERESNRGR